MHVSEIPCDGDHRLPVAGTHCPLGLPPASRWQHRYMHACDDPYDHDHRLPVAGTHCPLGLPPASRWQYCYMHICDDPCECDHHLPVAGTHCPLGLPLGIVLTYTSPLWVTLALQCAPPPRCGWRHTSQTPFSGQGAARHNHFPCASPSSCVESDLNVDHVHRHDASRFWKPRSVLCSYCNAVSRPLRGATNSTGNRDLLLCHCTFLEVNG